MKKQFILIIAAVGCLLTASYAAADNHPVDDIYATEKTPTLTKEQKKAEKARKKRQKEIEDSISFELAKKSRGGRTLCNHCRPDTRPSRTLRQREPHHQLRSRAGRHSRCAVCT